MNMNKHAETHRLLGRCPDCGGSKFAEVKSEGDTVCTGCGLVVASHIWEECEGARSFYEDGVSRSHVGAPSRASDEPPKLVTQIAKAGNNSVGTSARLLQRLQSRGDGSRRMAPGLPEMDLVMSGQQLTLPESDRELSRKLYSAMCAAKRHTRLPKAALQAVCVYVVCRLSTSASRGRDLRLVQGAFGVSSKVHTQANRFLSDFLRETGGSNEFMDEQMRRSLLGGGASAEQQLKAGIQMLSGAIPSDMVWGVKRLCIWISGELMRADHFDGKHLATVCGGVIVVACNELRLMKVTEAMVAAVMKVAPATVREHATKVLERIREGVGAAALSAQGHACAKRPGEK